MGLTIVGIVVIVVAILGLATNPQRQYKKSGKSDNKHADVSHYSSLETLGRHYGKNPDMWRF